MDKTLKIAFRLKNTYRVNSIIYALKQIPLIKRILPGTLYQSKGLKLFAQIIAVIMEIGMIFFTKAAYLLLFVVIPLNFYSYEKPADLYLHMILFLTLVGFILNTSMFNPQKHKYYAIILMRMNARDYTLASFGYYIFKTILGFMPFLALSIGIGGGNPLYGIAMAFAIAGGKIAAAAGYLVGYEKKGILKNENKSSKKMRILVALLLLLTYGAPAVNFVLPRFLSMGLMILMIPLGIVSVGKILNFKYYVEINKEILNEEANRIEEVRTVEKEVSEKNISNELVCSNKKGLEYLNDLFVKRHKKIFWKATNKMTMAVLVIIGILSIVMVACPETKAIINEGVVTTLPPMAFFIYAFNRGPVFTKTLFMNCDHSMLTYPFFKNSSSILELFKIRLRVLVCMNLIPAFVIGIGMCWILYMSGGSDNVVVYPLILVTILAMSFFFSIHYMTIYYLLQPYNAETEIKSGLYTVITGVTYFLCYMQINLHVPLIIYGVIWIGFVILYGIVASVLVYKFAPKTFRIRM